MNDQKFVRKDWNLLAICGLLLLLSVFYLGRNYRKAFPAYDIKFDLTRSESRTEAEKFLSRQNIDLTGYRHAVVFDYDEMPKTFIEKEVGLEEGSHILNEEFPIWRWSNRWFQPLSREEFKVDLTTNGQITYYEHIIPEEAAAVHISILEARKICQDFLLTTMQLNPHDWEFLEDKTDQKPNRIDYVFTYKKKGFEIFNATYRLDVGVQGNQIGKYREYWKLPEEWQRNYQHMRSLNSTTALSADIFSLLLLIAALVVFIIHLSHKNIPLKTALWFGIVTFALQFISKLNELPIQIYAFDTNQSLGNYYGDYLIQTFIVSLLYGLIVTIITGAGEALYRRAHPDHLALPMVFSLTGIRTKAFLTNSILGVTLAMVFIAFQTCFYLIANHFGAWAPAEVTYSDVLNTYFPWIFVLLIGFTPAVTEEFTFRLFAIPFIGQKSRSRILAVLIPALIWGFAHANYPNQPFWIRGAEVSLFGIFIGMIFVRFGILTVLVWHYTIDAIFTATFLIKTGEPYLVITASLAAGLIILPIIYNLFYYWRKREFATSSGLLNGDVKLTEPTPEPIVDATPAVPEIPTYIGYSPREVRAGLIMSTIFLAILLIPSRKIGEFYNYPVAKNEIRQTAAVFLTAKNLNAADYKTAIGLHQNYDQLTGQYIIEHSSLEHLNLIMAQFLPDLNTWEVRFFKPGERDEYRLQVSPMSDSVVAFSHILDEAAPGANLTRAEAQIRAEEYLKSRRYDLSEFKLAESNSEVQPNRTDYYFIWESLENHPASLDEARLRLKINVKGAEVAAFMTDYKIPEEWLRQQTRHTTLQSIMTGIQILFLILIIYRAVVLLFKKREPGFSGWRTALRLAVYMAGLSIIGSFLNRSAAMLNYDTSWSMTNWNFLWLMLVILKAIGVTLMAALMLSSVGLLFPDASQSLRKSVRPQYTPDALIAGLVMVTGLLACGRIANLIAGRIHPATLAVNFPFMILENSAFPFANAVFGIVFKAVLTLGIVALAGFFLKNLVKRNLWQIGAIFLLTALLVPSNYLSLAGYVADYLRFGLPLFWLFYGLKYFVGANPPAYLYTAIGYFTVDTIINLLAAGSPGGRLAVVLLIIIVLILILWLVTEKQDMNLKYLVKRYLK